MGIGLDIAGAIGNKALDWVDTAVQYYNQKKLNRQAEKDTQQNMKLAHELNLQSVADSYVQSIAGMRRAGINPSQAVGNTNNAVGVSSSAGNAGAAGMPKNSVAETLMASNELELQKAQKANLDAATRKTDAETAEIQARTPTHAQDIEESKSRIQLNDYQRRYLEQMAQKSGAEELFISQNYKRMLDEDSKATQLIRDQYSYRAEKAKAEGDEAARAYWQALADNTKELSVGTLYAMRDFASYVNDLDEYDKQMVLRALQKNIAQMQLSDQSILYDLAHLPVAQFENLMAQTADALASRDMRVAYATVGIPSEAEYRNQMKETTRHNDFVGNVEAGRYGDAALNLVPGAVSFAEDAAMLYVLRGSGTSKLATKAVKGATAKEVTKSAGQLSKAKLDDIERRANQLSGGDPVKRAQIFNKLVKESRPK